MKIVLQNNIYKGRMPSAADRQARENYYVKNRIVTWERCCTLLIDKLPNRDEIRAIAAKAIEDPNTTLTLETGLAICSPNDQFCRKTGLKLAELHKKSTTFNVKNVSYSNCTGVATLSLYNGNNRLEILYDNDKRPSVTFFWFEV